MSKHTQQTYRHALKLYFQTICDASEKSEVLADRYFTEQRDYERDIQQFQRSIALRPPKSVRTLLAIVKVFLVENEVELSQRLWRRSTRCIKGSRVRTQDRIPSARVPRSSTTNVMWWKSHWATNESFGTSLCK